MKNMPTTFRILMLLLFLIQLANTSQAQHEVGVYYRTSSNEAVFNDYYKFTFGRGLEIGYRYRDTSFKFLNLPVFIMGQYYFVKNPSLSSLDVILNTPNKDKGQYIMINQTSSLQMGIGTIKETGIRKLGWDLGLAFGLKYYQLYTKIKPNEPIEGYREKVFRVDQNLTASLAVNSGIRYAFMQSFAARFSLEYVVSPFYSNYRNPYGYQFIGKRLDHEQTRKRLNYLNLNMGLLVAF